jgi:hypothetical protein
MKHDSTLNKGHRAARTAAAYAKYDINARLATKSEKTGRPDWMSPASKCKLKAEADSKYVARRAGRDDAPKHDATSEPDRNNTAQQHVVNSAPIRERAANAEFQRNRED